MAEALVITDVVGVVARAQRNDTRDSVCPFRMSSWRSQEKQRDDGRPPEKKTKKKQKTKQTGSRKKRRKGHLMSALAVQNINAVDGLKTYQYLLDRENKSYTGNVSTKVRNRYKVGK